MSLPLANLMVLEGQERLHTAAGWKGSGDGDLQILRYDDMFWNNIHKIYSHIMDKQ